MQTFNCGLLDRDGQFPLHLGRHDSVADSLCASRITAEAQRLVSIRNAGAALRENGITAIDILKLDAKGSEVPILQALGDLVPTVGVLYVEYHGDRDRREIDRLLDPSHLLWCGRAEMPHRGELCYVRADWIPERMLVGEVLPVAPTPPPEGA